MDPAQLDRVAAAAWPPAVAQAAGGWTLRLTPGTRGRRLNSALPPPGAERVPPAVAGWYAQRGAPAIVQVTPLDEQAPLDRALAAAGWTAEAATDVLTLRKGSDPVCWSAGTPVAVERVSVGGFRAAWRELGTNGRSGGDEDDDVLARIPFEVAGLVARRDGALAGVALAVLAGEVSFVFEVATAPEHRRRGVARALMAAWARAAGDRLLALQVMTDNAPAQALYASLGFERSHGYHYRRAPSTSA